MGIETALFIDAHWEVTNRSSGQTITKYYFAGASRIAMRKYVIPQSMNVEYLLGDHLGSTSITTDSNGAKVSEIRYNPAPSVSLRGCFARAKSMLRGQQALPRHPPINCPITPSRDNIRIWMTHLRVE
jgi:hypothetical protein